jgi:hypothetical protein
MYWVFKDQIAKLLELKYLTEYNQKIIKIE